jgi:hypothetical protein
MEKKLKQLNLNKKTIARIDDMNEVRGGTMIYHTCMGCQDSTSCSMHIMCCDPPVENAVNDIGG